MQDYAKNSDFSFCRVEFKALIFISGCWENTSLSPQPLKPPSNQDDFTASVIVYYNLNLLLSFPLQQATSWVAM